MRGTGAAQLLYLHSDHLDPLRLATSAKQQIVWQWQSDAFGEGKPNQDPQVQDNRRCSICVFRGSTTTLRAGCTTITSVVMTRRLGGMSKVILLAYPAD